jgi:glycosyltransferase involved in cell wall biosynthesis
VSKGPAAGKRNRLAIVLSHPTQYFSPWFRHIAANSDLHIRLFYLWDFGIENRHDRNFGHALKWDIPLLDGYEYEFVPNKSRDPGTHHFIGLDNPELNERIADWAPDAMLLFGYTYLSHLRLLLSPRFFGIPLLLRGDSHDLYRPCGFKVSVKNVLRRWLFKRFSGALAVGSANADYFRHCGIKESKIHFVPHCVDNARFQTGVAQVEREANEWREELGISRDAVVFLFAGKFETKKRPQDLIAAFLKLLAASHADQSQPCVLVLVGAGELEHSLKDLAAEHLGKTIFILGFQNQTQMPKVYALGNLLVLPSFGEGETWGLAVNEAMNLARPVIVSSHVGCGPDLVKNNDTGWVFEAGNVDSLYQAMAAAFALGRQGLAVKGKAAKTLVEHYSYGASTTALVKSLEGILR